MVLSKKRRDEIAADSTPNSGEMFIRGADGERDDSSTHFEILDEAEENGLAVEARLGSARSALAAGSPPEKVRRWYGIPDDVPLV